MNDEPTIRTEVLIDAIAVLQEARQALSQRQETFTLATKCALAEGRLRGGLINALPTIDLKPLAA